MDYEKNYYDLIESRKKLIRRKGDGNLYEEHHIVPKSMGGGNNKENLILLTPREHYLAHYMLWKFCRNNEMACAYWRMVISRKGMFLTSRMYDSIKKEIASKFLGSGNPFFQRKHTEETRKKISELAKTRVGSKNSNFGNKWTEEQRREASLKFIGKYKDDKNPKARKVINLDTGEIFSCMKFAEQKYGLGQGLISGVCNGRHKRAGGYRWAFYKKEGNE